MPKTAAFTPALKNLSNLTLSYLVFISCLVDYAPFFQLF